MKSEKSVGRGQLAFQCWPDSPLNELEQGEKGRRMLKIRFGPEKNKVLLRGCETDIADIVKPNMMQVRSKVDFPGL